MIINNNTESRSTNAADTNCQFGRSLDHEAWEFRALEQTSGDITK